MTILYKYMYKNTFPHLCYVFWDHQLLKKTYHHFTYDNYVKKIFKAFNIINCNFNVNCYLKKYTVAVAVYNPISHVCYVFWDILL